MDPWVALLGRSDQVVERNPVRVRELAAGTVECLLIALSVFALAGVRFPERMLPILVFEVTWKVVWLVLIALPMWRADALDEATITQLASMAWVVIIAAVIPWRWLARQPLGRRPAAG